MHEAILETTLDQAPTRPVVLFGLGLSALLASVALGAITNAINGRVSPDYFVAVMHFDESSSGDVWQLCIAEGIFEGAFAGLAIALALTLGVGLITGGKCRYTFAARSLLIVIAGALIGWVTLGLLAMGLAALSPAWFRQAMIGVPDDFRPMLGYAWVGGSIWGEMIGAGIALVCALLGLRMRWREQPGNLSSCANQ